jgi:hypothetical protein
MQMLEQAEQAEQTARPANCRVTRVYPVVREPAGAQLGPTPKKVPYPGKGSQLDRWEVH